MTDFVCFFVNQKYHTTSDETSTINFDHRKVENTEDWAKTNVEANHSH